MRGKPRDQIIIATKFGFTREDGGRSSGRNHESKLRWDFHPTFCLA